MSSNFPPNTAAVVGEIVIKKLIESAGSLGAVARCSASRLQKIGAEHVRTGATASADVSLLGGYLTQAPLMLDLRRSAEVNGEADAKQFKKALDILSRKALLAVKIDLAGSSPDGADGRRLLEEVKNQIAVQSDKGKVSINKTAALEPPDKRRLLEEIAAKAEQETKLVLEEDLDLKLARKIKAKFYSFTNKISKTGTNSSVNKEEMKKEEAEVDDVVGIVVDWIALRCDPDIISYIQQELELRPHFHWRGGEMVAGPKRHRRDLLGSEMQNRGINYHGEYRSLSSLTPQVML